MRLAYIRGEQPHVRRTNAAQGDVGELGARCCWLRKPVKGRADWVCGATLLPIGHKRRHPSEVLDRPLVNAVVDRGDVTLADAEGVLVCVGEDTMVIL